MTVYILGDLRSPCLLILHELIIHVVEGGKLLEQSHKLLFRTILLYLFMMFQIKGMRLIYQFGEVTQAP